MKRVGWEDVRDVPDGTRVRRPVLDDTLPGGPAERIVEYVAPFGTADREHDYAVAWAEFERRAAVTAIYRLSDRRSARNCWQGNA